MIERQQVRHPITGTIVLALKELTKWKIFLAESREDSEGVRVACERNQLTEKTRNLPARVNKQQNKCGKITVEKCVRRWVQAKNPKGARTSAEATLPSLAFYPLEVCGIYIDFFCFCLCLCPCFLSQNKKLGYLQTLVPKDNILNTILSSSLIYGFPQRRYLKGNNDVGLEIINFPRKPLKSYQ